MTNKKPLFLNDTRDSKSLMRVALGQEKADLVITNANLVNVYTGELIDDCTISIKGKWIAYVGKDRQHTIGSKTEVIDAGGKTVIPGLIDGHTHLAWLSAPAEFLKYAMKGGTTTIVTETLESFPVAGYEGIIDILDALNDQPIKILATAPVMISISNAARGISEEALQKLLERNDIIGLGESYWQAVLQNPDELLPLFEQTLLARKTLEGHSAGASEKKLSAYIATGITSCHEPINADQVLERLRLGLHIMAREGAVRKDLDEIAKITKQGIDLRRLILVSDSISPPDLMENGYMEHIVQKAIDCGFEPVTAIQMTTLNVAEHFSIDNYLGAIAPGRYADLVIIPDVATVDAEMVISNGQVIAQNGKLLIPPRKHTFSKQSLNTIKLPRDLEPSDFIISAPGKTENAQIRVIRMITDLVTSEEEMNWPIANGQLSVNLEKDIVKIAAVDRTHHPGKLFVGLIQGFGLKSGAIACSAAWDTSDIVVVGADDADMAFAVNRIRKLQGGTVVCENQEILSELPLPVFGIVSDLPLETIDQQFKAVANAANALGIPFPEPMLSLITLTGAAIPYLRICEEGLVNLKNGTTLPLFIT
ncbi:MAG: adenine deaminase C-terminal domain-containing protein [Desulfobacterales bacterium]